VTSYRNDPPQGDDMRPCRTHGRENRSIQISVENPAGRASLRNHRKEWKNTNINVKFNVRA
jgi:hypothetical protein